jgi:hypothetical protein
MPEFCGGCDPDAGCICSGDIEAVIEDGDVVFTGTYEPTLS